MRISDWSSDVCSSDLEGERHAIILTDERAGIDADIESFGKRHQATDRRGHAHGHRRRTVDRQAGCTALPKPAAVIVEVEPDFEPSRRQRIGPVDHSPLNTEPVVHEAWHPDSHAPAIAAETAALRHPSAI